MAFYTSALNMLKSTADTLMPKNLHIPFFYEGNKSTGADLTGTSSDMTAKPVTAVNLAAVAVIAFGAYLVWKGLRK